MVSHRCKYSKTTGKIINIAWVYWAHVAADRSVLY